jgi:uncharacterized protein YggE
MNLRYLLLAVAMLVSPQLAAQVNALPPTRHILVYGDAEARAIPDRFKISLNFESIDPSADVARRRVEENLKDVLGKLKAAGVAENEIVATSMEVGTRERYDDRKREQVFIGTGVKRTVTARFDSQSALGTFLATLQTSKELNVSSVDTELADEAELRKALREKAIESSRGKAETIARAYGAKLGGLYSVSDVAPQFQYGIREGSWPSTYQWNRTQAGDGFTLDRIQVTGSRMKRVDVESFQTGYVTFTDKIYAVFLLAD